MRTNYVAASPDFNDLSLDIIKKKNTMSKYLHQVVLRL